MMELFSLGVVTPFDWSTINLDSLMTEFQKVIPIAIPVVIAFLAFRKGYAFLKKQIKGA